MAKTSKSNGKSVLNGGADDNTLVGVDHDILNGNNGNDEIIAGAGNQKIHGNAGDDVIFGGGGNDDIKGGEGFDTAVYTGGPLDYVWSEGKGNSWTVEGPDGVDSLKSIEALRFDDYTLYLDGRNNDPYAQADAATTDEDTSVTIDVLANDTDFDGDTVSVVAASSATEGVEVSINPDGTLNYNPGEAFQHLNDGETAIDVVTYEVSDGNGGTDTQTVDVTVTGISDQTGPVGNVIDFDSGTFVPGQYPWRPDDYIEDGFLFQQEFMGYRIGNYDADPDNEFSGFFARVNAEDGGSYSLFGLSVIAGTNGYGYAGIQGRNGDGEYVSVYYNVNPTQGEYLTGYVDGVNVTADGEDIYDYTYGMQGMYLYGNVDDVILAHDAVV